ncbi:hypothetical protein SMACR_04832 [Sordaria macrospora]|uniref:WGS project CABT00000000 data, contig 2.1 n=2 Tax=Sordaria macrospora TaxID=5147 RepID=F7VLR3_SORMK|nr:uncharacterized protein SMAC_04832 [Sordaria macrospora k-hell]KAA8633376.1 hypothetical protein SMACR_04832 [Sordaria macrospora]WPJ59408.1 hypothetical protein SMAC4_04832 [Sordaria macrospora]CCC06441.1 unnamed protein product [Sordaria macrospora k-hell]
MASPIGNLIHPPDPPRYRQGSSGQAAAGIDSILHSSHHQPQPHPGPSPSPIHHLGPIIGSRPGISSGLLLLHLRSRRGVIPVLSHFISVLIVYDDTPDQSTYRHIATHTLGKRFTCDICSKAFARADLLKRHRTNHQDDSNGTNKRRRMNSSPGAGRVAHACQACAKARVKCDEMKPQQTPYYPRASVSEHSHAASHAAVFQTHRTSEPTATDHSPILTSTESDESHLPTPSEKMMVDQNQTQLATATNPEQAQSFHVPAPVQVQPTYPSNQNNTSSSMLDDIAKLPFSDFLRDVLYDQSLSQAQGLAVLDFCDDSSLDLNAMDFGLLDYWLHADGQGFIPLPSDLEYLGSGPGPGLGFSSGAGPTAMTAGAGTAGTLGKTAAAETGQTGTGQGSESAADPVDISAMRSKLAQIWTESPWRWSPKRSDNVYAEQGHLPLSSSSGPSSPTIGTGTGTTSRSQDPINTTTNKSNANNSPRQRQGQVQTANNHRRKFTQQTTSQGTQGQQGQQITHTLHPSGRDLILSIVLSICKSNSSQFSRVASSFPSSGSINHWIHIFLASHLCSVSSFIPCHLPPSPSSASSASLSGPSSQSGSSSKDRSNSGSNSNSANQKNKDGKDSSAPLWSLNAQPAEWHAIVAAAGAVLAPVPALRKFGFALQEAVRVSIPSRFEENNSNVSSLSLVQALVLTQDLGVWSGNRRKMEIAECHLTVPVAMMRGRGKFTRGAYLPEIRVKEGDEGRELEKKWKAWMEMESWKRLAFHAYLRDAQVSMTQLVGNPSISYAEMRMPLPGPKGCWFARTKEEWKARMLEAEAAASREGQGVEGEQVPCLGDLLRDVKLLEKNWMRVDVQFAISIYLHSFWSLIWEYRQLASIHRPLFGQPSSSSSHFTAPGSFTDQPCTTTQQILISRLTDLRTTLHQFQALITPTTGPNLSPSGTSHLAQNTTPTELLLLHLLLMHIHVSLEDLQLFSGKEGEEQAKRIYPVLQRWADSSEARQALWHAGQVLRWAKEFPRGHLREFWAAGVHLGGLVVWGFGVLSAVNHKGRKGSLSNEQGYRQTVMGGGYANGGGSGNTGYGNGHCGREYGGQQQPQGHYGYGQQQGQQHHAYGYGQQQQQPEHQQQHQTGMSSYMQQVMTPSTTITTPATMASGSTPSSMTAATPASTTFTPSSGTTYHSGLSQSQNTIVYLDGPHTPEIERFIQHNQGRPSLQLSSKDGGSDSPVPLDDIAGCMSVCKSILKDNFPDASLPAISENIIALLGKLGGVAGVVGSGSG